MFEELFSRRLLTKTKERKLPKEIDAIQKVKGGGKRTRHSSMTVNNYIALKMIAVGLVVAIGLVMIGFTVAGLVGDFLTYSSGEYYRDPTTASNALDAFRLR